MDHGVVIRRHELSDAEWELVQPLLPRPALGRPRLDDRTVLNGIVWKFRTGVAWRDVPERYGSWASLHTRFRRWAADGTFERMLLPERETGVRPGRLPGAPLSRMARHMTLAMLPTAA
ncbi:transposase [Streptomyces dangxiongensis]|uniref:Transposase n=1 Tax=Streptomyces dangxiongensis TaxID=1442032 RepID=A0A3G2JRI3_9ACTN|nr:transposase [Streptomyces dangxiongensis]